MTVVVGDMPDEGDAGVGIGTIRPGPKGGTGLLLCTAVPDGRDHMTGASASMNPGLWLRSCTVGWLAGWSSVEVEDKADDDFDKGSTAVATVIDSLVDLW